MQFDQQSNGATAAVPVIRVWKLSKDYYLGRTVVPALSAVDLEIARGEFVAIMGPSGSGKSTLMNILGCLDRPTSGNYWLDGIAVGEMSIGELADVRNREIGFVFQNFNLLPWMTALANVQLPLVYAGVPTEQREQRALWALAMVGLASRAHHRPMELSGGQQQRVAIARAMANDPPLILADEPTGNLDQKTGLEIVKLLARLRQEKGRTLVVTTHDDRIVEMADVIYRLENGDLESVDRPVRVRS